MIGRRVRDELKPKICFDLVGCFADPPAHLTLKRRPEDPSVIQTKFLLYTRKTRDNNDVPHELVYYDDQRSMINSKFNSSKSLKIIIHGFKGSGSNGALNGVNSLLDLEDANVIILDWTKGAGTSYQAAVANTELVGRQLSLILLDAINMGTSPNKIHIIGFSLGAHVAGCASEVLKKKNLLLGRITGLDPASPFFRHHILREKSRKLDSSDAEFVDVIHTDGSEIFTDGFGLLRPIGHVDFFPNGGREQPGCTDVKNSVVYGHFHEDVLDNKIACSHSRSWELFVESLKSQFGKCKFTAWSCNQGVADFFDGNCFPHVDDNKPSQEMGISASRGSRGIYYLATTHQSPYCGDPVRASVVTSNNPLRTIGTLFLQINIRNSTTLFKIICNLNDRNDAQSILHDISAVNYGSLDDKINEIEGKIWYQSKFDNEDDVTTKRPRSLNLYFNKLTLEDRQGNRWEYCKDKSFIDFNEISLILTRNGCRKI
ncbi:pancreatic lipase-related protein 2-like isoform X2 [Aphidius gifuensis]|nr:pancreatic lipase-related protein 2-like isoform X2 [Aphidius gifuensis]